MKESEFDKVADQYRNLHAANIGASGEDPEYFADYKIRDILLEYIGATSSNQKLAVLDFGCGIGSSIYFVRKYFSCSNITGIDVSERSLALARERYGDQASFHVFDGLTIPFPDEAFDIAYAACVFHHIPHDEHIHLLGELRRVLKQKGMLLIYEHNPFNPLTVHAVNTCPFDKDAHLITARKMRESFFAAGFENAFVRYRVFFPKVLSTFRPVEKALKWLPVGAQYYVCGWK